MFVISELVLIDDLYKQQIALAQDGDRDAAIWLMKEFCATVKQNRDNNGNPLKKPSGIYTVFNEDLLDYLSDCFSYVFKKENPWSLDQAFGLRTRKTAGAPSIPPGKLAQREFEWCLEVLRLKGSGECSLLGDAKKRTARKFKVSPSAVEKAWKKSEPKIAAEIIYKMSKEGK